MFAARLRALREDDRGISLVELIIASMVGLLVLGLASSFFVASTKVVTNANAINKNTKIASLQLNETTRIIRSAIDLSATQPAFVSAGPNSVKLFTNVNLGFSNTNVTTGTAEQPELVQFRVDTNGNLIEDIWASYSTGTNSWGFPSASTKTINLGGPVVTSGAITFTYYNASGTVLGTGGTFVAAADLTNIASVQVNLTVGPSLTSGIATTLQNTITLPNLGATS